MRIEHKFVSKKKIQTFVTKLKINCIIKYK